MKTSGRTADRNLYYREAGRNRQPNVYDHGTGVVIGPKPDELFPHAKAYHGLPWGRASFKKDEEEKSKKGRKTFNQDVGDWVTIYPNATILEERLRLGPDRRSAQKSFPDGKRSTRLARPEMNDPFQYRLEKE